jgi:lysophospholipase L1-like esterase
MVARHITLFLKSLIFLLLPCVWASGVSGQPITLVTLGDSLTAGDGDETLVGGYPPRLLTRLLRVHPGSALQQFGTSGHTTTDLINIQLTPAVDALNAVPGTHRKIALVWIGSNDLFGFYDYTLQQDWCETMGIDACEEAEMGQAAENVNNILSTLKATGATLYVALLDDQSQRPVITDPALRANSFPNITDEYAGRMSTQVGVYNNRVKTHAATHGAQPVDFFNSTIFENWATLSPDGNHPNGAGYDSITTIWFRAINPIDITGPISILLLD